MTWHFKSNLSFIIGNRSSTTLVSQYVNQGLRVDKYSRYFRPQPANMNMVEHFLIHLWINWTINCQKNYSATMEINNVFLEITLSLFHKYSHVAKLEHIDITTNKENILYAPTNHYI
jgi:hypothetical protein